MRVFNVLKKEKHSLKTRHFKGFPPELTGNQDKRSLLTLPDVLIIEEKQDGIFLFRYSKNGEFGGDTWHQTIEDAKDQAEFEYGKSIKEWKEISEEIEDAIDFAIKQASKQTS